MKIVITGTSSGIGKAIALKFLNENHQVIGIDVLQSSIEHKNYFHFCKDVYKDELPNIEGVNILINNAGVQNSGMDIDINLKGAIKVTEKYGFQEYIKSILFVASASARNGAEFPEYVASKGGLISYMKNVALRLSKFNATANSISPGGVLTPLNDHVIQNKDLWNQIMDVTPLKKWATVEEIADWAYFVTMINKSMTGEDILIDNGEQLDSHFIW